MLQPNSVTNGRDQSSARSIPGAPPLPPHGAWGRILRPLANFDLYLCLRINFHTSSFWVLILAAGGPYWVLISQKNASLLGPHLKAWGSFLVLEAVEQVLDFFVGG